MADLKLLSESLIKGQAKAVKEMTQQAVNEGVPAEKILMEGLMSGMNVVGAKFKANEFYIPEVLIAARAMHAGMDIIKPLLAKANVKATGKFVVGTVKGDLHDIGKNLVSMMMEGAGFEIIDAGIDVSAAKFVEIIKEKKPNVIGMSALLTTTMPSMKETIEALKSAGLRNTVKVIIGGAPVTQSYADEIGADGYAADAASAVDKVKELIK